MAVLRKMGTKKDTPSASCKKSGSIHERCRGNGTVNRTSSRSRDSFHNIRF